MESVGRDNSVATTEMYKSHFLNRLRKKNTFYCQNKGAGAFHSAGQSKEGLVGFGTSQHPIFMKLLPDNLWH